MPGNGNLVELLLELDRKIERSEFFPTVVPEASNFALGNPYAFILATCLDRGTRSEIIWTIPYDLRNELGHLDSYAISRLSESRLSEIIQDLPRKPRYVRDAPRTIFDLTRLVVDKYQGQANRLWEGRSATDFQEELLGVRGVGKGIASMAVQLVERVYGEHFTDIDRSGLDIKADVHTRRVLYRLGVICKETDSAAVAGGRLLYPRYPGKLDAALWHIGHTWCSATNPKCEGCYVATVCQQVGIR